MGIEVHGNIIVKGDQIFDGGIKIVKCGDEEQKKVPLTKELLREKVDMVRTKLVNGRLWFPVCKYMMLRGLVPEGDFAQAADMLHELYPDVLLNAKDLSSLNVFSFRDDFSQWQLDDSPIRDRTTFFTYKSIGEMLAEL